MIIHSLTARLLISVGVFVIVLALVIPHLMDVNPPIAVQVLLKPADLMAAAVGPLLPTHNIGTPEKPIYEGTAVHLLVGLVLVFLSILLYPVLTYIGVSLLSAILKRRASR